MPRQWPLSQHDDESDEDSSSVMITSLIPTLSLARWFEPRTPQNGYLRWKKEWHLTFTNNYRPTRKANGSCQGCQRLAGGFCPAPFFAGITRWPRPAKKTSLRMSSAEDHESATHDSINFVRTYAHWHRPHTSKTALRSLTLKCSDAEERA